MESLERLEGFEKTLRELYRMHEDAESEYVRARNEMMDIELEIRQVESALRVEDAKFRISGQTTKDSDFR